MLRRQTGEHTVDACVMTYLDCQFSDCGRSLAGSAVAALQPIVQQPAEPRRAVAGTLLHACRRAAPRARACGRGPPCASSGGGTPRGARGRDWPVPGGRSRRGRCQCWCRRWCNSCVCRARVTTQRRLHLVHRLLQLPVLLRLHEQAAHLRHLLLRSWCSSGLWRRHRSCRLFCCCGRHSRCGRRRCIGTRPPAFDDRLLPIWNVR